MPAVRQHGHAGTRRDKPADYALELSARTFPFRYPQDEWPDLAPALQRPEPSAEVDQWAARFLPAVRRRDDRHDGPAARDGAGHPPATPLHAPGRAWRADTCRDAATRQRDVPRLCLADDRCGPLARFRGQVRQRLHLRARCRAASERHPIPAAAPISINAVLPLVAPLPIAEGGATYAWLQVYLPGAGWVDFDPTNSIIGNRNLIRVAVAWSPMQVLPLWCIYGVRQFMPRHAGRSERHRGAGSLQYVLITRHTMQIQVGYELIYHCPQPTPMLLMLNVHHSRAADIVVPDRLTTDPMVPLRTYRRRVRQLVQPDRRAGGSDTDRRAPASSATAASSIQWCPTATQPRCRSCRRMSSCFCSAAATARPITCRKPRGGCSADAARAGGACRRSATSSTSTSRSTTRCAAHANGVGSLQRTARGSAATSRTSPSRCAAA